MIKKGSRIRFKIANYSSDLQFIEDTGEIAAGTVIKEWNGGLVVAVKGRELPFYVTPDNLTKEGE